MLVAQTHVVFKMCQDTCSLEQVVAEPMLLQHLTLNVERKPSTWISNPVLLQLCCSAAKVLDNRKKKKGTETAMQVLFEMGTNRKML